MGIGYRGLNYPTIDQDVSFGTIYIRGRTPKKGYHLNELCKLIIYILEGEGFVTVRHQGAKHLKRGTFILLGEGEAYILEGNFDAAVSCAPAWSESQHSCIEDDFYPEDIQYLRIKTADNSVGGDITL